LRKGRDKEKERGREIEGGERERVLKKREGMRHVFSSFDGDAFQSNA